MQPQATLTVDVRGRTFALACPARPDELLERAATRGEEAPYWAELWPCARRLAGALCERELAGRRVVELGCGLGLPSLVAAARGADVLATDVEPAALGCVCQSATGLGLSLQTLVADYRDPPAALLAAAPFDLVVAADVLYEPACTPALAALAPRLLAPGGLLGVAVAWERQEAGLAALLRLQSFAVDVAGPRPWLLWARSPAGRVRA